MNTIDKILLGIAIFILIFITTMIVLFCIFQQTPDVLIESTLGLFGGEAVVCFAIWWIKRRQGIKEEEREEE